jgi:hypothetical protein
MTARDFRKRIELNRGRGRAARDDGREASRREAEMTQILFSFSAPVQKWGQRDFAPLGARRDAKLTLTPFSG